MGFGTNGLIYSRTINLKGGLEGDLRAGLRTIDPIGLKTISPKGGTINPGEDFNKFGGALKSINYIYPKLSDFKG